VTARPASPLHAFVEQARARAELESARPALLVLTAVLAAGTIVDASSGGLPHSIAIATINLSTLLVLCVASIIVWREGCPARRARPVFALAVSVALANILASLSLAGRGTDCAAYAIILVGMSSVMHSPLAIATVASAASLGWVAIGLRAMPQADAFAWGLAVFGSSGLSFALGVSRARAATRVSVLRFRDAQRSERLARSAAGARAELYARSRLESERADLRAQLSQAQKMEAIGTLAGGVAHDMNNVLAAITGLTEGALGRPLDDAARADLESVLEAAHCGAELTRNLLAFGRKGKYRSERISMRRVIATVRALLGRTLPKNVVLAFPSDDADDLVQGDPSQLQHALLNLCINATHALPNGGTIEVRSHTCTLDGADAERFGVKPGAYVVVEVRDDGCGMDDDTKRRAFEPFFTTKGTGRGTGLGLAMVYGTVVRHGGGVALESALGVGTVVTLALPHVEAASDARREPASASRVAAGLRVLLVDDEPLVRRGARRLLEKLGCRVVEVEDGVAALSTFRTDGPFDVVVLDMAMPKMGGAECFRHLRALDASVRVIFASGFASDAETDQLLAGGACYFLEKPYGPAALSAALDRCLARDTGAPAISA
jgi:signal transduction histidine kinase/ActR/RegA family two-component response regulator